MNKLMPARFIMEGTFSWDKPIEQEILEFTRNMRRQMERVASMHDSKSIREGAGNYAKAYATIEGHIIKEIEFRKKIKK